MTQQEKQINYMGPFITMVFLFFIVGCAPGRGHSFPAGCRSC